MSDPATPQGQNDDEQRPPRVALLIMVLFPFLLALGIALLYGWLRR